MNNQMRFKSSIKNYLFSLAGSAGGSIPRLSLLPTNSPDDIIVMELSHGLPGTFSLICDEKTELI